MTFDSAAPLASLLKEASHKVHDEVALSDGATLLTSGKLSREDYIRYLMMLWHVYNALEMALEKHASNPVLEPTYNPTLLSRAPSLAADISQLLQVDEQSWKSHPIHIRLMSSTPSQLNAYVQRIEYLSGQEDPSPLLAHSYVRYLGDLSGGQTIRHTLAKAYGLDEASGFGISFYAFKELQSQKLASLGEMKRIKDWFREGINVAGKHGAEIKRSIVEETTAAFYLNAGLLSILVSNPVKEEDSELQTIPLPQKTYPLTQVAAVIAAVCLSHFVLVVGGFTGSEGYQKLVAAEQWFANLWQEAN